jgi:DNA-binding MarR family transcriptional regulator
LARTRPPQQQLVDYREIADFRSALRRFDKATEEVTRRQGLTQRRYELLVMVAGAEDGSRSATISEIAARMHLAPQTATELVKRAEQVALVERCSDATDGRVTRVRLTKEGEHQLARAAAALRPERDRLTRLLGDVYRHARHLAQGAL